VVFCESREDAECVQQRLDDWLAQRGLSLSPTKTRIVHLREGFDFLGFTIRQYHSRTSRNGVKLLIKPSKRSVQTLRDRLREEWHKHRTASVGHIVRDRNPLIRGWANYFRIGVASKTFRSLDRWMFIRQYRYAKRRHPKKPWTWRKARSWGQLNPARGDKWVFGDKDSGRYLTMFAWFRIRRHVMVKGTASPDDPSLRTYWRQREHLKRLALSPLDQHLADRQGSACPLCGDARFNGEEVQRHHRLPRHRGGLDTLDNLALVHLYCHQ